MVRTVATAVRASGGKSAKAARNSTVPTNSFQGSSGNERHGVGGNPVHHRETPSWQKPITNFFIKQNVPKDMINNLENPEKIKDVEELLGESSTKTSDLSSVNEMEVELSCVKENLTQSGGGQGESKPEKETRQINEGIKDSVIEKESTEENGNEINSVPEKQGLDFYKGLEEIENNLAQ